MLRGAREKLGKGKVQMALIRGTSRGDTLPGTAEADEIHGLQGNDTIRAGAGDDLVFGEDGDDILDGEAGQDSVHGGNGNDTLTGTDSGLLDGGNGHDRFILLFDGRGGDLIAYGGAGHDSFVSLNAGQPSGDFIFGVDMYGEAGNDSFTFERIQASLMDGGSGNDSFSIGNMLSGTINGGSGADTIRARTMLGTISGDAGNDTISIGGAKVGSRISGGDGNDVISVGGGAAVIDGGAGNDSITDGLDLFSKPSQLLGGIGNDTLRSYGLDNLDGGEERDILESSGFGNVMTGGSGADRFVYGSLVNPMSIRTDTITDFNARAGDRIDLSVLLDRVSAPADPVADGWLGLESLADGTALLFDADGGADGFVQLAILQGVTLSTADLDRIIIS